jgi:hypothetical protein
VNLSSRGLSCRLSNLISLQEMCVIKNDLFEIGELVNDFSVFAFITTEKSMRWPYCSL